MQFNALFIEDKQDLNLIKKLTTPENLSGLLNLALVGVKLLEKVPIEVIREEYNRESQSLKSFIENRCTINLSRPEYFTATDDFYNSYLAYCERIKEPEPLSAGKVDIELSHYKVFKKRIAIRKVKKTCYKGIIMIDTQRQETLQQ